MVNAGPSEDVPVDKLQEVVQDPGKVFSLVEEAEECEKLGLLAGHQRSIVRQLLDLLPPRVKIISYELLNRTSGSIEEEQQLTVPVPIFVRYRHRQK